MPRKRTVTKERDKKGYITKKTKKVVSRGGKKIKSKTSNYLGDGRVTSSKVKTVRGKDGNVKRKKIVNKSAMRPSGKAAKALMVGGTIAGGLAGLPTGLNVLSGAAGFAAGNYLGNNLKRTEQKTKKKIKNKRGNTKVTYKKRGFKKR